MRALALLALLPAFPALVAAHPLEPSLLELHESASGRMDVVWTTPARRVPGVVMRVVLPPRCRPAAPSAVSEEVERIVTRWSVDCGPGDLVGERVSVTDLAEARSEVLVRIVYGDGRLVQTVLTADVPELTVPARPRWLDVAGAYGRLGIHHILTGIDHLAFVLGLLLLVGGRSFLPAITAFTLGHSATLALAVLNLVRVPQRPIEVLIAASVFVLAVELVRDGNAPRSLLARRPWLMACAFGLLHGFGFAGALAEVGLPQADIPLALASFNVGVELGQIAFVGVVLGAGGLVRFAGPPPRWGRLVPVYAMGTLAAFWCFERIAVLMR